MKRLLFFLGGLAFTLVLPAQITLMNEDFGPSSTAAQNQAAGLYDLDPAATYLPGEVVTINNYGSSNTSEGKYEGASGENFFLLTNNWSDAGTVLTWANIKVTGYSALTRISFGCAFSGGANDAWLGAWMFSMQYSLDDVAADPENATWNNIDLSGATGWPDPTVAGADNWSLVSVPVTGVNLNGADKLSFRIKSNAAADYHFDDLKLEVKTPSSGQERVDIARETFGPSGYFKGPANAYEHFTNGGTMTFNAYAAHFQNYGNTFPNSYTGNTNTGNWWITDKNAGEDTLVFTVNTEQYADVNLEFGFTYWGGTPGSMMGVAYTTDSLEWFPINTVSASTPYPGINVETLNEGYFHLIRYDNLLPRAPKLTIKIWQATDAQAIIDDIALTGVYSPVSDDATLSAITFPGDASLELSPAFSSDVTAYTCTLAAGTKLPPELSAATTDPDANYSCRGCPRCNLQ